MSKDRNVFKWRVFEVLKNVQLFFSFLLYIYNFFPFPLLLLPAVTQHNPTHVTCPEAFLIIRGSKTHKGLQISSLTSTVDFLLLSSANLQLKMRNPNIPCIISSSSHNFPLSPFLSTHLCKGTTEDYHMNTTQ